MSLALDIGLRRLPLIVERVELLLQTLLGRDAGVDGAAQGGLAILPFHGAARGVSKPRSLVGVRFFVGPAL